MTMDNGSQPLIRLDAVSKVFVTDEVETHALQSIHFDVKKGEYLSISGPSGCGKSTLLAILGLLDTPTDGTYYLNGKPVTGLKLSERARIRNREIGFIFQAFNLIGDLTVYENVELPLTYRGMPSAERKKRVQEALERVGMSHRMKHYPSQLSGGQQQRVAVARALSGDPLIFGRAAEEMSALRDADVAFEVVPGITSAFAAAAAIPASLTDRHKSSRVIFVSGHQAGTKGPANEPDWNSLAQENATIVVYMPGSALRHLSRKLVAAGLAPETSSVVVARVSTSEQKQFWTTVQGLGDLDVSATPSIVLIGRSLDAAAARAAMPPSTAAKTRARRSSE